MPPSEHPSSPRALATSLREAAQRLAGAGIADPGVDVELLAAHVLGTSRGGVQAASIRGDSIEGEDASVFDALVERRAARVPLQHLTGLAPFRRLVLQVGPGVFVPRPETEIVAQFAIDSLGAAATPSPIAVDLGTGSGALALALATEVPHATVYGVEKSPDAFIWAKGNAEFVGATNARIVRGDLDTALPELDGTVDVVVSNPPYVPNDAIPRDPEVRFHDPEAALYGGPDGLDVVRRVSRAALRLVHPGGTVVIEHGEWQGAAVRDILTADGWRAAATHPDLTMRDRATTALRP
ncbi:MAG: peptide chain release factor N(5)-glutamine methyltransferase [Microbacterium sp.]|uniref:peptide chain release factor N(5)-glutamine methyltransferase n=1 Tax=Microbacterium sp. TaxID=51671 RepID=UPI0027206DAC|nr:peptide chain release factor N(5)-glutamine methyltransferase [Microbacterium sp.]MDO8381414.1 peptide chain release factor N(5)-glutamine methyltransferase [Microbacterium sp.]